jgi:transcriptional regulator with XRE-family HTH domain
MEIFAQSVKERATALGLSQAEVARRCGVTERAFNHYMSGRSEPNLATLLRVAEVLDCTPNDLLGIAVTPTARLNPTQRLRAQITAEIVGMDDQALHLALSILTCIRDGASPTVVRPKQQHERNRPRGTKP